MSVYRRFQGHRLPSLITTNVVDHCPLFADREAADALLYSLEQARDELRIRLHAWVIMPDHLHLVLEVPDGGTSGAFMRLVKARFARRWNHQIRSGGAVWQTRFHERVLTSERALRAAIEYVHANPVAAGLVESPDDYVFSSANAWGDRSQAELLSREPATDLLKKGRRSATLRPNPA